MKTTILLALLCAPLALSAQNIIAPPHLPKRPMHAALQIRELKVHTEIREGVATTVVDHIFYNPGSRWEEGTFIFPLPQGASIKKFSMWIGGVETEGELLDAPKARRIYEDIVRRMIDPALLEYHGSGLLKARVFPIEARSEKRVRLSYTHLLERDDQLQRFHWPLRACRLSKGPIHNLIFSAEVHSKREIKTLYAPSHPMEVVRHSPHRATVSFEASKVMPLRNMELLLSTGGKGLGMDLLTHTDGNTRYFWMSLMPPLETEEVVKRDVVLVVDTSGSMAGPKIEQARRALAFCIQSLNPGDRFEIINFSTEARGLGGKWLKKNTANTQLALNHVKKLRAIGGTHMSEALDLVAQLPDSGNRLRTIILLSDGKPTIGVRDENKLLAKVGKGRAFPFGIGFEINTHLLDKMAAQSGGWRTYVTPDEDLELKLSAHVMKTQSPVLAEPQIAARGVRLTQMHPKKLPELFKGTPLHLFGKYEGTGSGEIVLEGKVNGRTQKFRFDADFPAANTDNDFIPGLWAQRRVGYLLDEIRLGGEHRELVDEVIRLAKQYGIITPYTSFLIQEDKNYVARGGVEPLEERASDGAVRLEHARQKSGKKSVRASRDLQDMVQAESYAAAPKATMIHPGTKEIVQSQMVAGRTFYQQGAVWQDSQVAMVPTQQQQRLVFGSKAYFQLLKDHPEVAPILSLGQQVQFVFQDTLYTIVPS